MDDSNIPNEMPDNIKKLAAEKVGLEGWLSASMQRNYFVNPEISVTWEVQTIQKQKRLCEINKIINDYIAGKQSLD